MALISKTKELWEWITGLTMPWMLERGYSMQGAENWIRARGLDFSHDRFVGMYRSGGKAFSEVVSVRTMPEDAIIPRSKYAETDFSRPERYRYNMSVDIIDGKTGKSQKWHRFFYSDSALTRAEAERQAMEYWGWKKEKYGITAEGASLDSMEHNAGWSW